MSEEARQKTDPKPRFKLYTIEELEKLPDPAWLIDGLIPEGGLVELYGAPGAGKSFLALDWALSVAADELWLGCQLKKGDVVYVSAEGGQGLKKRIAAWRDEHTYAVLSRFRAIIVPVNMLDQDDVKALAQVIKEAGCNPDLVVIDTLARCFGGWDENQTKDMNLFITGADQIKAAFSQTTVLVVHHTGKKHGAGDRGSSALRGAADTVMKLHGKPKKKPMRLECEKQKDWDPFEDVGLSLKTVTLPSGDTSCVVTLQKLSEKPEDPDRNENDTKALDALRKFGTKGATFTHWKKASGIPKSTFQNVLKRLPQDLFEHGNDKRYRIANSKEGQGQGQGQKAA